jgi:hypothetical protein
MSTISRRMCDQVLLAEYDDSVHCQNEMRLHSICVQSDESQRYWLLKLQLASFCKYKGMRKNAS